jgi:hypothetical protein
MKTTNQIEECTSKTVFALRKAGRLDEALEMGRKLYKETPTDIWINRALGWVLYDCAKLTLAHNETPQMDQIRSFLEEYANLHLIERPSLLHSLILSFAIRVVDHFPTFPDFVRWWNVETLRPEDWMSQKAEGDKEYPALAERLVKALNKSVKMGDHTRNLPWIAEFMRQALDRFPDDPWLPYYYAKLLVKQGRLDEAREIALPVIRAKRREFWAWDVLASTCGQNEVSLRKACLCKALMCGAKDESFLINVILELAQAMKADGELAEAKHEYDRYVAIRAGKGWKIPESVQTVKSEPWYASVTATAENKEYYAEFSPNADTLVFAGLPWLDGVISGRVNASPGVKGNLFILVRNVDRMQESRVNPKGFPCLSKMSIGTPVSLRVVSAEGREHIVDVKVRDGQPWDLLPESLGVVSHINTDKGLAAITIGVDTVTLAYFDHFPEAQRLNLGDVLAVRCQPMQDGGPQRLVVMRHVSSMPSVNFAKSYQGTFLSVENKAFGFAEDIFISDGLARSLVTGDLISGLAVLETNRKTGRKGWKALTTCKN